MVHAFTRAEAGNLCETENQAVSPRPTRTTKWGPVPKNKQTNTNNKKCGDVARRGRQRAFRANVKICLVPSTHANACGRTVAQLQSPYLRYDEHDVLSHV